MTTQNWWKKFAELKAKPQRCKALGLMSGTSLDGLDIALVELETERLKPSGFVANVTLETPLVTSKKHPSRRKLIHTKEICRLSATLKALKPIGHYFNEDFWPAFKIAVELHNKKALKGQWVRFRQSFRPILAYSGELGSLIKQEITYWANNLKERGKLIGQRIKSNPLFSSVFWQGLAANTQQRLMAEKACQLKNFQLLAFQCYPYDAKWQQQSRQAMQGSAGDLSLFHHDLGIQMAILVKQFLKEHNVKAKDVAFIASHGQTIFHAHGEHSLQLGEADCLSKATGIPVIFDFRQGDVAAGGSGAPLVPFLDELLARKRRKNIVFLNLGGIANFTFISQNPEVFATDTGPANLMSNYFTAKLTGGKEFQDENAHHAIRGYIQFELLQWFFHHPFFTKPYPKSTGHEDFGHNFCEQAKEKFPEYTLEDFIHTSLLFSAQSILLGLQQNAPEIDELYVSGGGVHNPLLMKYLKQEIRKAYPNAELADFNTTFHCSVDAKEAVCFAILGLMRILGLPSNLPTVTGSTHKVSLGKIALPD